MTSRLTGFESSNSELQWKEDVIGHGTHCSGTIAAARNGKGVVGVAPDAEVYTVKVFGSNGAFAFGTSPCSCPKLMEESLTLFWCYRIFDSCRCGRVPGRRLQHCFNESRWAFP